MTLRNAFEDLATSSGQMDERQLQEAMVILLASIVEKMPRVDTADRLVVSHAESSPSININASQTLAALANVTNIGGRDAANAMFAMANMGALHIYNNIVVS